MKLEDQVCSLDLAKRLKELGVKQEGLWRWVLIQGEEFVDLSPDFEAEDGYAAAFTVAELGEMLPERYLHIRKVPPGEKDFQWVLYETYYEDGIPDVEMWGHDETAMTEADARAKMLVYLIEKGLVKP